MKKIIFVLYFVALIYTQHTEYYSTLKFVESPYSKITGSVSLSKSDALKRNHYRFEFNKINQLIEIAFYNKNRLQNINHTANLFFLSSKIKIQYKLNYEIYSFYDRLNKKTSVLGNVHQFVYKLNDNGYRKELYFKDISNKEVQNSWDISRYFWEYNEDGSVIENRYKVNNEQIMIRPGFEFYRIRLSYNNFGHISLMQNIDENGNLVENNSGAAQDRIETNADGNMIAWNVLDKEHRLERGNGPDVARGTQTFNAFGYESSINYFDELGNPIKTAYGFWGSKTLFDQYGNISDRVFIDGKGNPHPHEKAGYVYLKIDYDSDGYNRHQVSYFDKNKKPINHLERGYHKVKYEYDESNNLTKVSYFNTQNKLVDRLDNKIAFIINEYDNDNQRISSKRFNRFGQEITND